MESGDRTRNTMKFVIATRIRTTVLSEVMARRWMGGCEGEEEGEELAAVKFRVGGEVEGGRRWSARC